MPDAPVLLTADRVAEAAEMLAAAFRDDPITQYLYAGSAEQRGHAWSHGVMLRMALPLGTTYATPGPRVDGVATFYPPGRYPTPLWAQAWGFLAAPLRLPLGTVVRGLRASLTVGRVHPKERHWYLATLGVHPDRQRQGVGGFLMTPTLERADGDGLPVYLETTKAENVTYYQRFGFEVARELTLAGGGPPVWTMLRPPRR